MLVDVRTKSHICFTAFQFLYRQKIEAPHLDAHEQAGRHTQVTHVAMGTHARALISVAFRLENEYTVGADIVKLEGREKGKTHP